MLISEESKKNKTIDLSKTRILKVKPMVVAISSSLTWVGVALWFRTAVCKDILSSIFPCAWE